MLISRRGLLAGLAITAAAPALSFQPTPRQPATWPGPTRELMVPVPDGGRVYVRINGDLTSARAPLMLVHGGPGGTHASLMPATALATDRAVILYDQLGCGRSDRPAGRGWWTVPHFVSEVDAIRQALGLSRLHLLGHSWGGTVALEYAARRPAGLLSTVLASPLISTRAWIADADALRRQLPEAVQKVLTACDARPAPACTAATNAFYGAFNGREPASPAAIAYARTVSGRGFNADMYRAMWGGSEFSSTGSLRDYDGEPLLARLGGHRTLFLGGQYDEARPSTLAGFAARVAGAEFAIVPGAAHGLFGDRPTETLGILSGWLERHDA